MSSNLSSRRLIGSTVVLPPPSRLWRSISRSDQVPPRRIGWPPLGVSPTRSSTSLRARRARPVQIWCASFGRAVSTRTRSDRPLAACASVVPSSSAVGTTAGWLRGHPRVRLLRPRTSLPPAQTLIGALPMSILSPLRSIMQSLVLRDPVRSWTLAFRLQLRFRFDRCPVGPLFRSGFGMRRRPRPLVPALRWSSFCPQGVTASSVSTAIAGLKRRGALEQRADNVLVVLPRSDAPPAPVGASSRGS